MLLPNIIWTVDSLTNISKDNMNVFYYLQVDQKLCRKSEELYEIIIPDNNFRKLRKILSQVLLNSHYKLNVMLFWEIIFQVLWSRFQIKSFVI